jgi:hypothetical protein
VPHWIGERTPAGGGDDRPQTPRSNPDRGESHTAVMALTTLTAGGANHPWLIPILFVWLGLNLTLWSHGWRLLRRRSDAELDALYVGSREI